MRQDSSLRVKEQAIDPVAELYRLVDRLFRSEQLEDVFEAALDAITANLNSSRASILLFDTSHVMRFVAHRGLSEQYRNALEGHTPWSPGQRDAQLIAITDIMETNEPDWIKEAIKAEGIVGLAFIPLFVNSGVAGKFMVYYSDAHALTGGEVAMALTIARQVGFKLERHRAELERQSATESLRESEERFRLMADQAPVMIWLSDPHGACLHLNRKLRDFWGIEGGNVAAFNWHDTIHPDDAARVGMAMVDGLRAHSAVSVTARYRNAGNSYRCLQTEAQPRFSERGEFLGMIGVNVDITERETLLSELNHRVKNTLSLVQSIAYQTFRNGDPQLRKAFEGRLVALGLAHNLLTQNNWGNTSLPQLVGDVVSILGQNAARVRVDGPSLVVSPQKALALSMAFHELLTNAMKYGALSNDAGKVSIVWTIDLEPAPQLHIVWTEAGGPPVLQPERAGFGSRLLERSLSQDLGGEVRLDYKPEGLLCAIKAAVPPISGYGQWVL